MATKKNKDNKGPATQSTGTQGVNAVGVNHGTNKGYVSYSTHSLDADPVPGKKLNVVGVPGATIPPAPWDMQQPVQQPVAQVQSQTATNVQQNPVQQSEIAMVEQKPGFIAFDTTKPGVTTHYRLGVPGATVYPDGVPYSQEMPQPTLDNASKPVQQPTQAIPMVQPAQPATIPVKVGGTTIQMPVGQAPAAEQTTQTATNEPTAAQQNAEYEARRQQEAEKEQYNQAVDEYRNAGGNPNAIRQHSDPYMERLQPTAEQVQQAQANAQKQAQTDDDEYVKTLKEYLDSKYQSPEDKAAQEKREARQRRWAAISEGIANVFNVGGSVAGARPAQWKSAVGDLYANQEAEIDKRRAEYREALRDMITYRNAIRNGDIARARAIEDKRRNDIYEYRIMQEQEAKAAERKLKADAQEKDQARKDQDAKNKQRKADDDHLKAKQQLEGTYKPSGNTKKSSSGGGRKKSSGGSRATGAAAAKSAKAAAKRRAKAATRGTKFGKK